MSKADWPGNTVNLSFVVSEQTRVTQIIHEDDTVTIEVGNLPVRSIIEQIGALLLLVEIAAYVQDNIEALDDSQKAARTLLAEQYVRRKKTKKPKTGAH